MSVDSRSFRKALGTFPTGVAVITGRRSDGGLVGITVSSFTSLSLEPPLVLFCLDSNNSNLDLFEEGRHFGVNVLHEDQKEISIRFASRSEQCKFSGLDHTPAESGVPLIKGCLAHLDCRIVARHEGGDHFIIVGSVEALAHSQAGQPLVYWRGAYAQLGCSGMP